MTFNNNYKIHAPIVEIKKTKRGSRLKERIIARKEKEFESKINIKPNFLFNEPDIIAISQVSRFHSATLETLAKEVDLTNVTITVQDEEILSDSKLLIKASTRYGLVGRNGVGKSTLLKVVADGTLVGLPANIKALAIQQIPDNILGQPVIDAVLSADKEAIKTIKESKALAGMVTELNEENESNGQDKGQINRIVGELLTSRAYDNMVEAQRIATHRSGKRGGEARTIALEAEKNYSLYLDLMKEENKDMLNKTITTKMINDIVSEVFEKLALVDVSGSEARGRKILKGLGFSEEKINGEVNKLSGGWRMRVALAQALFYQPDLLLLDEPTNHLDLPAINWLKKYLIEEFPSESSIVVISHDRAFLNAVAQEIIIFKNKKLEYFPGNYDNHEEVTSDLKKKKERLHASIERRRKHIESSMNKAVAHAKASGDDKRLGMVASRKIRLEKMGMNKTEDGKKFKQSYRAGWHSDYRPQVVLEKEEKQIQLPIPDPTPLRTPGPLAHMENVTFGYSDGPVIVSGVTLNIQPHTRLALSGMNGSGKSTILGLLHGELTPRSGKIIRHSTAQVGYFAQHHVDALNSLSFSALAYLIDHHPGLTEPEARQWLGSYGLSGRLATQPVCNLSGGQKARVILTDILLEGPHLLILDEVTNHLDLASIEALAFSLNEYEGAIVCVSHDQWFLETIATQRLTVKKGKLVEVKLKKSRS